MAPRYHTNQTTVMKGWLENDHEVRFLSQYAGQSEDYTCVKPIVLGYSMLFRAFYYLYVHVVKRNDPYAADIRLKCGIPPLFRLAKCIREFWPDAAILRERSVYTICTYAICRHYKIPTILYNQTPMWEKAKTMDFMHRVMWKLTPKYRITPVNTIGTDTAGLVRDENAFFVPFLMEPQAGPEERTYFSKDRINVLCIGKYQERKNLQMMVEAVEELLPRYNLHLVIAGENSNHFHEAYYWKVDAYIKEHKLEDKVTLLVNLNRSAVHEEYKKADLFVLPSTEEPAAVSHLEAMAFSIPAISGSNNGTAGYIEQGKTGYIFADNDKEDLKEKMEKIFSDKDNLMKMGAAAYQHVKESFQFENYEKCIREILKKIDEDDR